MPHGRWKFMHGADDILLIKAMDSWNKEGATEFANAFKEAALPLIHSPWAIIISTENAELMVPEALAVLENLNQWAISNNCVVEANIIGYQIHKDVIEKTRAKKANNYVQRTFSHFDSANEFISAQGFLLSIGNDSAKLWFTKN